MPSSVLNSDDGVISGTSGLKSSGGDDGILKIQNNGTDAVTVADDGDVTLAADLSVTGNLLFNSGFGSAGTAYGCRAWVNFDGTTNVGGNCTIRASGNVSTVADNGTGDYTVNFTTAMPDANYSVSGFTTRASEIARGGCFLNYERTQTGGGDSASPSTTFVRVFVTIASTGANNAFATNSSLISVQVFR